MNQTFEIPGRFLGRNETEKLARTHYTKAAEAKKDETELAMDYAKKAKLRRVTVPSEVAIIFVEQIRYFKNGKAKKLRDVDNVMGAAKPILDGLVAAGVLPDDGPYWVRRVIPTVKYEPDNPHVTVSVMDYEPYRIVYYQPVNVPESACR